VRLGRRPALDGLRGVAVLFVLLDHGGVLGWGYIGVDVFFVLSGFLITTLLLEEWSSRGAISLPAFCLRRARRLLPALTLLVLAVSLVERLGFARPSLPLPVQVLTTAGFVNNWVVAFHPVALGLFTPTWSLAQEEQFYLLWPVALVVLLRRRIHPTMVVGVLVAVAAVLVWLGTGVFGHLWSDGGYYDPLLRAAEPLIGCLAALLRRHRTTVLRAAPFGWLPLPGVGLLAAAAWAPLAWRLLAAAILTGVLLIHLGNRDDSAAARLLSLPPLRYVGRISYGLYLYQEPLDHLTHWLWPGQPAWLHTLVLAGAGVAVAALSWHLVERAFLTGSRPGHPATTEPGVLTRTGSNPESARGPEPEPAASSPRRTDIATLEPALSARTLLGRGQRRTLWALLGLLVMLVTARPVTGWGPTAVAVVSAVLSTLVGLNIVGLGYQCLLALLGARATREPPAPAIPDDELPGYAVLVPLYREETVLPTLITQLAALDYPRERLHILLLVERDDHATRAAIARVALDERFDVRVFPPSQPRTKPKACNLGLEWVDSEFCTIYDAEDRPAPDQLRNAVARFRALPEDIACVQAELHFWNPHTNWLAASFTAEYALRYGLTLHGLDRMRLPIPLGGNSNHFRTSTLCELGAWDPFNLTEDADLGMRIARHGGGVRMLDSVTEEEANSQLGNWLRQRSRWIKGHLQTWLVHTRSPTRLLRELGALRFCAFHLTLGFPVFTALINPLLWLLSAIWLFGGPAWSTRLLPPPVYLLGLFGLIFGYLATIAQLTLACHRRRITAALGAVASVPLYWLLITAAAYKGLAQLLRPSRRHYWELTRHGLVEG
jgi:peptidoglycan/LPS O-acetylase OafA/YrhL/cellulose synthase/poly-beta-1,6-N-acetylglucosamine synthase-like glycosyltransferase